MTPLQAGAPNQPIQDFSDCHVGITRALAELNSLSRQHGPSPQRASTAQRMLDFFEEVVASHHVDEEKDLFPAVLSDATVGEERTRVEALVQKLIQEHRRLETRYASLVSPLNAIAQGQDAILDPAACAVLAAEYLDHARFEEQVFLPLAQRILGRDSNHMAALGLSLHIRHATQEIRRKFGFI